jgi:hypothetical protein
VAQHPLHFILRLLLAVVKLVQRRHGLTPRLTVLAAPVTVTVATLCTSSSGDSM